MAKIITIDTSTTVCSVALHDAGDLVASRVNREEKSHSKYITLLVEEVLAEAKLSLHDVDAFAVSKGPGSYTGLCIGVATVKGYCFALNKPMLSINTLEGMWQQVKATCEADFYAPMLDARRMEVYVKIFDQEKEVADTEAKILDEQSFEDWARKGKIACFGDGSEKFKNLIGEKENFLFLDDVFPNAAFMGKEVFEKYTQQAFEDVAYFEPFYLKNFVATTPKKALL